MELISESAIMRSDGKTIYRYVIETEDKCETFRECVVCGQLMIGARLDKKTCSARCRMRLSRAKAKEL